VRTRVPAVARKEFREIRRDPITLWVAAVVPVVLLGIFGYALRIDFKDIPMAVLDYDRSRESAGLVEAFTNTGDFAVREHPGTERELRRLLDGGQVRLGLVVPRGFGRNIVAGRTAPVQTLIDGSLAATAAVIRNEVDAVTLRYTVRQIRSSPAGERLALGPRVESRVWYNPGLRSEVFVVPGLFGVILMAFPPLLTALAIVREKESGSIEQIYVSPLRPWEFIAGKMLPYVAIAFLEMATVVALGMWWFGIPFRGSPALLILAAVLYVFCTVGIGLVVSTVTRSQVVALLLATVLTIMPSFLFSGFLFPISSMPMMIQMYTFLFPARYFNEISRGLFLKGTGLAELWPQFAILALYTATVFTATSLRFRKKVA
jgi:ABC-2 type transport system permease protein